MSRLGEKIRSWLRRHPLMDGLAWGLAVVACVALLVWFYGFSGFGAPPEFVYEQF
ncbi:hypothetical protein [Adlercreutzia aquisgranensis]|uniref:hypothetical protein n=1 Tax=Adlercreutzia aquisgranensis TaxID=2941323 RepID=UPI00203AAEC4|nr:hypothetical protein [Adlercreutzia aquisgranensis]